MKEEPAILSLAGTAWQMLADRMRRHDHYFCNDDIRAHYYTQTFQVTHLKNLTFDSRSLTVDQEAKVRTSSREQTFVAFQLVTRAFCVCVRTGCRSIAKDGQTWQPRLQWRSLLVADAQRWGAWT